MLQRQRTPDSSCQQQLPSIYDRGHSILARFPLTTDQQVTTMAPIVVIKDNIAVLASIPAYLASGRTSGNLYKMISRCYTAHRTTVHVVPISKCCFQRRIELLRLPTFVAILTLTTTGDIFAVIFFNLSILLLHFDLQLVS